MLHITAPELRRGVTESGLFQNNVSKVPVEPN